MEKDFNSDYLRGHIDTIILKTLLDGEKYGYEICKDIETKSNKSFVLKQPSLYSALKRLESSGLINSRWQDSEIGGKRHYYSLTPEGIKQYENNKMDWNYSAEILNSLIIDKQDSEEPAIKLKNEEINGDIQNSQKVLNEIKQSMETNKPTQYDYMQYEFFNNNIDQHYPASEMPQPNNNPEVPHEKAIDHKEKNDAVFINETYIEDENDISFSNNIYLRVKNTLSPTRSQGSINMIANNATPSSASIAKEDSSLPKSLDLATYDYSIKPYSKFSSHTKQTAFIKSNKLFLYIYSCIFLIMMVETIGLYIILRSSNNLIKSSNVLFICAGILAVAILIIASCRFASNPYKKKIARSRSAYIRKAIWFSSLSFLTILINLLIDTNCFATKTAFSSILLPIILLSNIIISEALYHTGKKMSLFKA